MSRLGSPPIEAWEQVGENYEDVLDALRRRIAEEKARGLTPRFDFSTWDSNKVIGCGFIGNSTGAERFSRLRQRQRDQILGTLQKMNDYGFQVFCADTVSRMGFRNVGVGPHGKDGCIDFYGLLDLAQLQSTRLLGAIRVRMVGQAKRFEQPVPPKEVNHFEKKIEDFEHGANAAARKVAPDWLKDSRLPLIRMFFTSSYLTRGEDGAAITAERSGMIVREGDQLAEDLISLFGNDFFDAEGSFAVEQFQGRYS